MTTTRMLRFALPVLAGFTLVAGGFLVGRSSVPTPTTAAGPSSYSDGFAAGRAAGVQEGRALQEGQALTGSERDGVTAAFNAGYTAGVNDAFGGYDGGWSTGAPYAITLTTGTGGATYRILSRLELQAGVDYYICPDGHSVCQSPR